MDLDEFFRKRMAEHKDVRSVYENIKSKLSKCDVYEKEPWTFLKLVIVGYYIGIYSNIAKKYFEKIAFFDLYAGSGINYIDRLKLYLGGSAYLASNQPRRGKEFNEVILFELDNNKCDTLRMVAPDAVVHCMDCNCSEALRIVKETMERNRHYLSFIDPEGVEEVRWNTLENLFRLNGDIMLNYPYSAVARVHGNYFGKLRNDVKEKFEILLNQFFGNDDWKKIQPNRQGDQLLALFVSQLKQFYSTIEVIKLGQERGGFKFHLILGTKSSSAPWFIAIRDLKTKISQVTFTDLERFADIFRGEQEQLTEYFE